MLKSGLGENYAVRFEYWKRVGMGNRFQVLNSNRPSMMYSCFAYFSLRFTQNPELFKQKKFIYIGKSA